MMAVDLPVFSLVRRTKNLNEYTYDSVAESIYLFVDAIKIEGSPFYKDFFQLPAAILGEVFLFVNSNDDDDDDDDDRDDDDAAAAIDDADDLPNSNNNYTFVLPLIL